MNEDGTYEKCETCKCEINSCYDIVGSCNPGTLAEGYLPSVPVAGPVVYGDGEETTDGLKYDVHKTDMTFLADWGLALEEICKLSAFGAKKYERGGWTEITNPERLKACMLRHYFKEKSGEPDADSSVMHDVAVAWNALSALQIRLQNE